MFDYTYRKNIIYIIYSMHTYTSIFKKTYMYVHILNMYINMMMGTNHTSSWLSPLVPIQLCNSHVA